MEQQELENRVGSSLLTDLESRSPDSQTGTLFKIS
jgi:hypothetical protein